MTVEKKKVEIFVRGWLGYFGIASMGNTMKEWDGWLRRRFRMHIWKQWNLLIQNGIQGLLFKQVVAMLTERGLSLKKGTIVDSTIIEAPSP